MKISKLFHWLYASVMMLPLVVVPIFAIYSHRHTIAGYEVTRDKYQVVDFNQLMVLPLDNSSSYFYVNDCTLSAIDNNEFAMRPTSGNGQVNTYPVRVSLVESHIYLYSVDVYTYSYNFNVYCAGVNNTVDVLNQWTTVQNTTTNNTQLVFYFIDRNNEDFNYSYFRNLQIFDLTQMFGVGNEPSISQFDDLYTQSYYEYTLSKKELLNVGTETLNNTDIGSQLLYAFYNPLNDYFNVTNFLGLNNLYSWINFNVFNGGASLGFSIFYMLLSYWLLVSIFWLVFDVVMYVPNLAHRWLDKGSLQ